MPAGDHAADLVAEVLQLERFLDHFRVRRGERDDARHAQEVRHDEEADVQDVAGDFLAHEEQLAQEHGLLGGLHAEGRFHSLERGQPMAAGADAADAAGEVGRLVVAAAAEHRLEEARGLGDFPLQLLDPAVAHVQQDVAVALDPRDVVDADIYVSHFLGASVIVLKSVNSRRMSSTV